MTDGTVGVASYSTAVLRVFAEPRHMAGLCGAIGADRSRIDPLVDQIVVRGTEEIARFDDGAIGAAYVDHPTAFSEQPIRIDEDRWLWIWGVILGHDWRDKYTDRPDGQSGAAFVADRIREYGLAAVSGLNSEFSGIVYDTATETVSLFTDRLGTRPLYYTHAPDGSLVFAPLLQSLGSYPGISLSFDRSYVSEFLHYNRALGVYTPVEGVYQLPPASIITVTPDGRLDDEWTYWWPQPRPSTDSYARLLDRFATTFAQAVADRVDDGTTGLFLSGGVDSRAILAALDTDVVGFHFNEQREGNLEARLAERAAQVAGTEFEFLHRGIDHYPGVLEATGQLTNFNGYFRVANHFGFEDRITSRVSHIFNGQYSDTLVGPTYVPTEQGEPQEIDNLGAYLSAFAAGEMGGHAKEIPFTTDLPHRRTVLSDNVTVHPNGITNHGVTYPSWEAMVQFGMVYPITNVRSFIWYETQVHCFPTHYPFLDNRIVDRVLETPAAYRYEEGFIDAVVQSLNPRLAGFERRTDHPAAFYIRNAPLTTLFSDVLKFVGLTDGVVSTVEADSHLRPTSGFPHTAGLVRSHPFLEHLFQAEHTAIADAEFIDEDELWECYRRHLGGDNYTDRLFGIASILQSSIDATLADSPGDELPLPDAE